MTTATAPRAARRPIARPVEGQEIALAIVLAVLWLVLSLTTDTFLTGGNLQNLLASVAPVAVIGVGMTAVIVTAGIDVSVGSGVAVVAVAVARLVRDDGVPLVGGIAIAVVAGALLGTLNGALVAYGRVHPIVVTFATLNLFRFGSLLLFGQANIDAVPGTFQIIGGGQQGLALGVPIAWWLTMLIAVAVWFHMRHRVTGRHWYAVGGDADAARLAGVKVTRRLVGAYVLTGALVGIAACFLVGSGGTVQRNIGTGLELRVIAAVVIGGTSILGGRGTVLGTLLGAVLVGTVSSAVTLLGWPSQLADLLVGVFIVVAVGADLLRERRRSAL
jgi:ribose transport system permease protein